MAQAWNGPAATLVYCGVHALPSPASPSGHAHENVPGALVQIAFASQSSRSDWHSSMSSHVLPSPW